MEISKIINSKVLVETATLFEVTDNRPKKVAEVRTYSNKTKTEFYAVFEVYEKYKAVAGKNGYKNGAVLAAAKEMGMYLGTSTLINNQMLLGTYARENNIQNPFISEV